MEDADGFLEVHSRQSQSWDTAQPHIQRTNTTNHCLKYRIMITVIIEVDVLSQRRGTLFLLTVRRLLHAAQGAARLLRLRLARIQNLKSGYVPGEEGWFREQFGEDVNLAMLAAFRVVLNRKLPVCCVFADTEEPQLFESALPGLLKGRYGGAPLLEYSVISGTEHAFTMSGQTEELNNSLMKWLDDPRRPWAEGHPIA